MIYGSCNSRSCGFPLTAQHAIVSTSSARTALIGTHLPYNDQDTLSRLPRGRDEFQHQCHQVFRIRSGHLCPELSLRSDKLTRRIPDLQASLGTLTCGGPTAASIVYAAPTTATFCTHPLLTLGEHIAGTRRSTGASQPPSCSAGVERYRQAIRPRIGPIQKPCYPSKTTNEYLRLVQVCQYFVFLCEGTLETQPDGVVLRHRTTSTVRRCACNAWLLGESLGEYDPPGLTPYHRPK